MSFTANYSLTPYTLGTMTLTDTSTGSDGTITERRIYLTKTDGTTIVPSGTTTTYIVWAIGDSSITLTNILDRDYALNIRVLWYTPTPTPGNTYEVTYLYGFDSYTMTFLGKLSAEDNARYPDIVNDTDYVNNKLVLYNHVLNERIAISLLQNIGLAQSELDKAYQMITNPKFYF